MRPIKTFAELIHEKSEITKIILIIPPPVIEAKVRINKIFGMLKNASIPLCKLFCKGFIRLSEAYKNAVIVAINPAIVPIISEFLSP